MGLNFVRTYQIRQHQPLDRASKIRHPLFSHKVNLLHYPRQLLLRRSLAAEQGAIPNQGDQAKIPAEQGRAGTQVNLRVQTILALLAASRVPLQEVKKASLLQAFQVMSVPGFTT